MTVKVTGAISTTSPSDVYPTHLAELGKGGMRSVNLLADLDLIPVDRREIGMLVYVVEDDTTYQLTQTGWKLFKDVLVLDELADANGADLINFGTVGDIQDATGNDVADTINVLIHQAFGTLSPINVYKLPAIYSVLLSGIGTVAISGVDFNNNIFENLITYTVDGNPRIEYPYFNNTYGVTATTTGTAKVEIL